jgi:uncharacterized membrane-anchored protein
VFISIIVNNITMKNKIINKLPEITLLFWIMKIAATTLGETAGDLFSMTLNIGYAMSSIFLFGIFVVALTAQLRSKKYRPSLYWMVILATSTAGTTMSDFMDRTLGLGYATGTSILLSTLLIILSIWYFSEKSLSVTNIKTKKAEVFYWLAILVSNTLGTALGDFLAHNSGLGFTGGATLVGGLIALTVVARYFTKVSPIILFWVAFILTRPFGATIGDLLTKNPSDGGLGFGTIGSSLVLVSILIGLILYTIKKESRNTLRLD